MDYSPSDEFSKCVDRYRGDARHRGFSCLDQHLAMGFAQLTYRASLRDIEACLGSISGKLHHMGFRGRIALTNLAGANEADDPIGVDLDHSLQSFVSKTANSLN